MINWIGKKEYQLKELEETFNEGLSYLQEICKHIFQENTALFDFTVRSFLWLSDPKAVCLFVDSCPHYGKEYVAGDYEFEVSAKELESFGTISRSIQARKTKASDLEWITLWWLEEKLSNG